MESLQFAHPVWLVAGIIAGGGLIVAYRYFDRKNRADLEKFVSGNLAGRLLASISKPRRWTKRACFVGATILLFAALARPQVGHEWREVKRKGIDILFALDASRSMLAEDVSPNRLERAKLGMVDFVDKLEGDRVGLMPFAGSAFMLCPLTLDYHAFRESLDAIDTEIIPRKGTDLASAIREAERVFEDAGNNHKILVVITDGEDLQGEAIAAAKQAAEKGMTIHTVGIGSTAGELIPIGNDFVRDANGELVRSKLDENSLNEIAAATGGIYAQFGQGAEGLRKIYAEKLSLVPKGEVAQRMQKVPIERFYWPLAAALVLSLIHFLLGERRQARSGDPQTPAAAPALVTLAFLALASPADAATDARLTYNEGVQAYQGGDLEGATASFKAAVENTTDLSLQSRAYYNLGNTIFKSGAAKLGQQDDPTEVIAEWERSLEAFDGALALDPADEDAKFNRDLVQKKIDELKKQQEEQQEQQQDSKENSDESEDQSNSDEQEPEQQKDSESESEQKNQDDSSSEKPGDESEEQNPEEEKDGEKSDDGKTGDEEKEEESSEAEANSPEQGKEQEAGQEKENSSKPGEPKDDAATASESGDPQEQANPDQKAEGFAAEERRKPGEMSKEEARQLLQALENDEERVLLVPAKRGDPRDPNTTTKGKDW